jgi:tRNA (cmo5U34)-methyltransferase
MIHGMPPAVIRLYLFLAIHHLNGKKRTFGKMYTLLDHGGYFLNIDVVLAPAPGLEQWYLSLWKDWIDERRWDLGIADDRFGDVIRHYKESEENKPDRLKDQMDALEQIGFRDVDCYYKNGIFSMFGGRK